MIRLREAKAEAASYPCLSKLDLTMWYIWDKDCGQWAEDINPDRWEVGPSSLN